MSIRTSFIALGLLATVAATSFAGENSRLNPSGRDSVNMDELHMTTSNTASSALTAAQERASNAYRSARLNGSGPNASSASANSVARERGSMAKPSVPVIADDIYRGGSN